MIKITIVYLSTLAIQSISTQFFFKREPRDCLILIHNYLNPTILHTVYFPSALISEKNPQIKHLMHSRQAVNYIYTTTY